MKPFLKWSIAEQVLFLAGLFLFMDDLALHWITSTISINIGAFHVHHWMYGIALVVIAAYSARRSK